MILRYTTIENNTLYVDSSEVSAVKSDGRYSVIYFADSAINIKADATGVALEVWGENARSAIGGSPS